MNKYLAHIWDKLGGNFRTFKEEYDNWVASWPVHRDRVSAANNWLRGPEDKDGKLHAAKNIWREFWKAFPKTLSEIVLWSLVVWLLVASVGAFSACGDPIPDGLACTTQTIGSATQKNCTLSD